MLLDSNILIYAAQPQYDYLVDWIGQNLPSVSAVSMVEVLGYHRLNESDKQRLETLFNALDVLYPTPAVIIQAIELRQQRKMSLGDALIAATALVYQLSLVTRNLEDFQWIVDLKLLNPIKD